MDHEHIITKRVTNILRKYMTKELVMMFTNTKKSGDKLILKDYEFHRCLTGKSKNY